MTMTSFRSLPMRRHLLLVIGLILLLAIQTAAQADDNTRESDDATGTSDAATNTRDSTSDSTQSSSPTTSSTTGSTNTLESAFPTITGVLPPPLIVPDTSGAPFMQRSHLPEGTVFICVGAALGFFGACVLAWRGLVAWSLHRSVKRAAETTYAPDNKSMFGLGGLGASSSAGYKSMYSNNDSAMSLDHLSSAHTGYGGPAYPHGRTQSPSASHSNRGSTHDLTTRRTSRQPPRSDHRTSRAPGGPPDRSSLFFSPTANNPNPNTSTALANPSGTRSSTHLPAGYYASTSSAPAAGNPITHFGGGHHPPGGRASPHSRDGSSHLQTPPDSPLIRPRSSHFLRPDSPSGASMTASVGRPTSGTMQVMPMPVPRPRRQSGDRLSGALGGGGGGRPDQRRSRLGLDSEGSRAREGGGGGRDAAGRSDRERERTPSAYFDDLLENHGFGPGERFQ